VGAWIETTKRAQSGPGQNVASHVGAWIETNHLVALLMTVGVASHVGAWIETWQALKQRTNIVVASHVGAWIETLFNAAAATLASSHPMWVRGLKLHTAKPCNKKHGRIPCGCVD